MDKNRKQKSKWIVWIVVALFAGLLFVNYLSEVEVPLKGASFALLFVVGGYIGMDQFAGYSTSKRLPKGYKYTGSYRKLFLMIVALLVITGEALVLWFLKPAMDIPMDILFISLGIASGLFVGGNKANNAAEQEGEESSG